MNSLSALFPYLRRHKKALTWGFVALFASDAFQLATPWVFKFAIDGLQEQITLQKQITQGRLLAFGGALLGMAILGGFSRFMMRKLLIGVSREVEYELRNDFFKQLTRLSYSFYNRTPTGDLMARATNDLNAVRAVLGPGIMYSVNTAVTLAAALTLMFILSWQLTLISLIPLPLISFYMLRYGKVIHDRFEEVQERFSTITARAQEYLSGIRVVKAYVQEDAAIEQMRRGGEDYRASYLRLVRVDSLFSPAIGFLAGLATLLVLGFGGWLVMEDHITLGSFVAFNTYLGMLIWPMIALGWVVSMIQRGAASMKRLNMILQAEPEIVSPPTHPGLALAPGHAPELEFRDVHFSYPSRPETEVLRGLNLKVRSGETVALVGRTGSGKTSLVHLIMRVYDPTSGHVLLDGRDLRDIPLDELRGIVGYVPQETFLFSRTIAENIALGRPDAAEEDIHRMAELSKLADDVVEFPDRYATLVGERGVTLSGGQKQRTAIARALLRNPGILVLDDALASVDTKTEEAILSGLREFMKHRTTLLVAHRVSTVMLADRIVVIENGHVIEEGTHAELLNRDGVYAELAKVQELEAELEAAF
jgi:ATP-binding cassette, subfamily B, multidrug efflux pump